jgi:hypothetical protein
MNTKRFYEEVIKKLKWYVYLYFDPREDPNTRRPFYVGKGVGNRAFAHLHHIDDSEAEEPKKVKRIAEIRERGREPEIEILRFGLTEGQAFLVEASVIDCIGLDHLTNEIRGEHSGSFGRVTVKDVLLTMSAPKAKIEVPCVLININQMYSSRMTGDERYEATRGIWRVGRRREKADFAMAVFRGVIIEVYRIKKPWVRASLDYKTRDTKGFTRSGRWEFVGDVAHEQRKKYVGRSVRHLVKRGSQNPIHYVNCKK